MYTLDSPDDITTRLFRATTISDMTKVPHNIAATNVALPRCVTGKTSP